MKSTGSVGKQSNRYECQLLRKANTVWRIGMTTNDVCLMFTWALKIAPGFPISWKTRHDKGKCTGFTMLFRSLPNVGIQHLGMWGMYNLAKAYRSIKNPLPIAESRTGMPANGHTKDTTRLFHGPWHDAVGEHICAQPFSMWNRLRFSNVMQVSPIFERRKSDANKQDFENKLNLTCQAQSTPKTIEILTKVFCTSGPNLVVLACTGDELSHG